ncbi:TonB-dependent receptor [Hymenobacter sp. BT683]|uniref:TonB-dependent receptor n=1 Tax=Hymenobacter jeongseonensis TaxID=2791027 RepID=A0ABS0IFS0_9BACT|nr:TonB-dependent receptor [Hymenobacter jeongseonensis]MBF9236768.1 TonB-dependent receptor [Hymenobacter jeongseonensis]
MNNLRLRHLLLLALMLFTARLGWSQGATTAAMSGVITDKDGMGLPGATVIAIHTPTNTQYPAPTNSEGRFNIQNMRVGGPYTVRVTFVGYKDVVREGLSLSLGQNLRFDQKLSDATTELSEVTVSGRRDPIMSADRTGASTTVQRETIERLPTLNRSLGDFTRLTPQANGQSFGGRNSGFNNITIDGAIFNNAFGLQSTVGGQAGAQPISLDAIDQIQVSIAPFDVRQGSFTGAGINVVTRSGTNKISASIYDFYRNQDLVGSKVGDVTSDYPKFNLNNIGFRVGGPIIKDKLFFFVNAESERRNDPPTGNFTANRSTTAPDQNSTISNASGRDLDVLSSFLQEQYGYNPGPYENYNLRSNSDKATIKLDWNISANHRFNIKYNYLRSYADIPPSTSGAIAGQRSQSRFGLPYLSSYYTINNNLNSLIGELNSTLGGGKYSNNLTVGYSAFRDFRESSGGIFPLVDIGTSVGLSTGAGLNGINATNSLTTFGYEPFSAFNILNSDVFQVGDNFTAYLGKHNVTVGTYNEFYKFRNGFAPNYYGNYSFNSLEDFYASAGFNYDRTNATYSPLGAGATRPGPQRYNLQYSALSDGSFPYADITAAQLGLYAQDEWSPRNNLRLTIGLRADLPYLTSDLVQNTNAAALTFRDGVKINTGDVPNKTVLFSPRVGFNWDVNDDRKTQLRGGTGIFTGRVPFVWLSNQASNNGVQFGSFSTSGAVPTTNTTTGVVSPNASVYPFNANVDAYRPQNAAANTAYNLAVTDSDFKFPQVWRTNLAVDQELIGGVIGTLEAFYTKDINAVYHQNVNLPGTEGSPANRATGADTRAIFYTVNSPAVISNGLATTTRNFQIYGPIATAQGGNTAARPNISDAILMKNTNKGYSYAVTGQLQKSFSSGLYASVAYTYSDSRSVNDGGSIAQSIWRDRAVSGDPNSDALSYSNFLQQHRVILSASYRREYLNHLGTTLSLFYEAAPAGRFSYVYSGDMNGDNQTSNDLMYVPRTQSEINLRNITLVPAIPATTPGATPVPAVIYTADQQWADLNNYINQDDYLSTRRGEYAERNGAARPWQNRLDFRLLQDIFTNLGTNRNTLQLSVDLFNVGNLINSEWGTFQTANRTNPLTFVGYNAQTQPVYEYRYLVNPVRNADTSVTTGTKLTDTFRQDTGGIGSRWQGQVGIRYIFN